MPVALRSDFNAPAVRAAAKQSKDGPQTRRLLAVAAIYDGATRTQAAAMGVVTLQIGAREQRTIGIVGFACSLVGSRLGGEPDVRHRSRMNEPLIVGSG